jgi:hypothetical protein
MNKDQKNTMLNVRRDLAVEFDNIARYVRSVTQGKPAPQDLPPALKARVDALIAKHSKKP